MEKNIKVAGIEKSIENVAIVRKPLDNEESIYCSIFGYYPKFKCDFAVCSDGRRDRLKKTSELYETLIKDGFEIFVANYSNTKDENEEYVYTKPSTDNEEEEEEEITKEISLVSFIAFNDDCVISFGNDWTGITIVTHKGVNIIKDMIEKFIK